MRNKSSLPEKQVEQHQLGTAQQELFLVASHQLKSPLAIIQWCLQALTEGDALDPKSRELVRKALSQANGMSRLLADMLHAFRLAGRKGQPQAYTLVSLNRLLDDIMEEYQMVAEKRNVRLTKGPIEILPGVMADELYLKQALVNLVDNAIKYSPAGGAVTVSAGTTHEWIEVRVQDEGIGIAEADQQRIFKEFFRGEAAKEFAAEGTGLGLALVKLIIDELGGQVVVESRPHQGSVFTIRLPIAHKSKK